MRGRRDEEHASHRAFRIEGVERDLDDELAFHFTETVDELVAGGMSREEAEAEARRRFGDESRYRAELETTDRHMEVRRRRRDLFGAAAQTLRFALRSVRRSPGLSAGIVLTLALGIGANATMFSTIDRLLLRAPDHIREPETLRRMWVDRFVRSAGQWSASRFSYQDFLDLRDAETLPDVAAYTAAASFLGEGADARRVLGWAVTGSFWELLGVQPHLGRFFTDAEDDPDGDPVLVLGYGAWQRDFGGDPSVIGRSVRVGGLHYTVVGVAPRGFTGAEFAPTDIWLPFHHQFHRVLVPFVGERALGRGFASVNVLVRLPPHLAAERLTDQAHAVYRAGRRELVEGGSETSDQRIAIGPVNGPQQVGGSRGSTDPHRDAAVALWLGGVALLLLLIASANAANLLLARSIRQRRETAVRLALGVSRRRLVVQAVAEGLLLALLGGGAALLVTRWGGRALQHALLPGVEWGASFTVRVLLFVLAAAATAGLLSAIIPAFQASRYAVAGALRTVAGGARSSARTREWLVGGQAALSVLLLVGAGLFVRSFARAHASELGFDAGQILAIEAWFMSGTVVDLSDPEAQAYSARAVERLATVPGVVAAARGDPPFGGAPSPRLRASGHDTIAPPAGGGPFQIRASPGYLRVLGVELVAGRGIEPTDRPESERVAIVSREMERHLWPDDGALGKCLFLDASEDCTRVVGVAADRRVRSLDEATSLAYYVPLDQHRGSFDVLLARVRDDTRPTIAPIKRALTDLDSRVPFVRIMNVQGELVGPQMVSWRLGATLFSAFGLLAAVVAAIGLYSVLAFDVEERRREIGLRTALGASRDGIVAMFVRRATRLTVAGSAAGIVLALVLAPRIQHLLFQTSAHDPLTFGGIAAALVLVGVAAAGIPAWRAARVDPNVVLREE